MSLEGKTACLSATGLAIGWPGRMPKIVSSGIDLELVEGEFAALVGPNGAGKSTLLRTLAGFQPPLRGEVALCGADIRRLSVEERARRAACVFTDRFDSGYFTLFDIVAFGRYPYTGARNRLSERDRVSVDGAIDAVGLTSLARRRFSELSDGERQKALVARAIAQDCPLLVLDEPTAFLDAPARVEIFHIARDLARQSRKAVVLSTHDLDHALRYADRLWLIDKEHRLEAGTPEDLATSGAIGRAFDGKGFRFDEQSGAFRSVEAEEPYAISIEGPAGSARNWTSRLAERLGLVVAEGGRDREIIGTVEIVKGGAKPSFAIHGKGDSSDRLAGNYDELARQLSDLISRKRG